MFWKVNGLEVNGECLSLGKNKTPKELDEFFEREGISFEEYLEKKDLDRKEFWKKYWENPEKFKPSFLAEAEVEDWRVGKTLVVRDEKGRFKGWVRL